MRQKKNGVIQGSVNHKALAVPHRMINIISAHDDLLAGLLITAISNNSRNRFQKTESDPETDQHIIVYCVEGAGRVSVYGSTISINAGNFFIIPKHTKYTFEADEIQGWNIYCIQFTGHNSLRLISYLQNKYQGAVGRVGYNFQRIELFNIIYYHMESGYNRDNLLYSALCFYHYLASFMYPDKFDLQTNSAGSDPVEQAIDFMKKNIAVMCTLRQMAAAVHLSPSHLSFRFKKKTGVSPKEYFNQLKARYACQQLQFTSLRIKDVADLIGMNDAYYFSRFFKKLIGVSPNTFRAQFMYQRENQNRPIVSWYPFFIFLCMM